MIILYLVRFKTGKWVESVDETGSTHEFMLKKMTIGDQLTKINLWDLRGRLDFKIENAIITEDENLKKKL